MMRKSTIIIIFMAVCYMFLPMTAVLAVETGEPQTATAFFPEERYSFGPVVESTEVRHDFRVQNHGTGPLIIKRIETG